MSNLIADVLEVIFKKLEFDDLLVCRNVCQAWKSLIDIGIAKKPLYIRKLDESKNYHRMLGEQRIFSTNDLNSTCSILSFRLQVEIHDKITKLITYNPFVLVNLNLNNLVYLEIRNREVITKDREFNPIELILQRFRDQNDTINLKFKNLMSFVFKAHTRVNFVIDADRLQNLDLDCRLDSITIVHPKTVQFLTVNRVYEELTNFKNLTKLKIDTFDYRNVKFNLIKQFRKLSELLIHDSNVVNFNKLMAQKKEAKSCPKIYYKNIDTDMDNFDFATINRISSIFIDETTYQVYLSNLKHVKEDELTQFSLIIKNNLNVQMHLFNKFIHIKELVCKTHKITKTNWVKLLKSLKLDSIIINSSSFEQNKLDLIPIHSNKLTLFEVNNFENLEFLLGLAKLERIILYRFVDLDLVGRLIKQLDNLKKIEFLINNSQRYTIENKNNLIILSQQDQIIFSDCKDSFLRNSISNAQSWSELLNQNGNAICAYGGNDEAIHIVI